MKNNQHIHGAGVSSANSASENFSLTESLPVERTKTLRSLNRLINNRFQNYARQLSRNMFGVAEGVVG